MSETIDTEAVLASWSKALTGALEISDLAVDITAVLALAADAAHAVIRPAAPLSTFIVGYAAGLAAAGGTTPEVAVREATEVARRLCRDRID